MVTIIRIAAGGVLGALLYDGTQELYKKIKVCYHDYKLNKKKENGLVNRLKKRFLPLCGK